MISAAQPSDPVKTITEEQLRATGKMLITENEFVRAIDRPTDEELSDLERQIISDGCLHPLAYWVDPDRPKNAIIIDGHNRYEICKRLEIPFSLVEIQLASKKEVIDWIYLFQLGRRNLTETRKKYYRGKLYNNEKCSHGGDRKSSDQNEHLIGADGDGDVGAKATTGEKLAKTTGKSPATIRRDAKFADALDNIATSYPEAAKAITREKVRHTNADVSVLANLPDEAQEAACRMIEQGAVDSVREAIEAAVAPPADAMREPGDDGDDPTIEQYIEQLAAEPKELLATLRKFKQVIKARAESTDRDQSYHYQSAWPGIRDHLDHLKRLIDLNTPHAPCVHCHGERCKKCDQLGFLTKFGWDSLTPDSKALAKAAS